MGAVNARSALAIFVLASTGASLVLACNAIVGVTEVRLRDEEDAGPPDDPPIDDPPDEDGEAPPPKRDNHLEVALGELHTCARTPEGKVRCWGDDTKGQTGTGGGGDGGVVLAPTDVGIEDAISIASGKNHTCAVHESGKVSCWGDDLDGQLGDGQTASRSLVPVDVVGLNDAVAVTAGSNFTCALRAGGAVACWGANLAGQLGTGNKSSSSTPVAVTQLAGALAVSAGEVHACAVTGDGKVACWGDGYNGQLGNGSANESLVPAIVPALDGVVDVAAASRSTCAVKASGEVFCWGANELGQLGTGAANATPNPSPTIVSGLDAVAIAAGQDHACAEESGGTVVCWGRGYEGQLGDGVSRPDPTTPTPSPVSVSGITNAIDVATGGAHSCAPTSVGSILCWGDNGRGQLGDGTQTTQYTPVSVNGYP